MQHFMGTVYNSPLWLLPRDTGSFQIACSSTGPFSNLQSFSGASQKLLGGMPEAADRASFRRTSTFFCSNENLFYPYYLLDCGSFTTQENYGLLLHLPVLSMPLYYPDCHAQKDSCSLGQNTAWCALEAHRQASPGSWVQRTIVGWHCRY